METLKSKRNWSLVIDQCYKEYCDLCIEYYQHGPRAKRLDCILPEVRQVSDKTEPDWQPALPLLIIDKQELSELYGFEIHPELYEFYQSSRFYRMAIVRKGQRIFLSPLVERYVGQRRVSNFFFH